MGFRKIETLHCLIREERALRFTCECGHVGEYATETLIYHLVGIVQRRRRDRSTDLADLPEKFVCSRCGGKRFKVEHLPRST